MIKRTYFYKVESLPLLRKNRRKKGLVTMVTGLVTYRSWRVEHDLLRKEIISRAAKETDGLEVDELVLTSFSKV